MTVPHTLTFDASPSARSTDENGFLHVASSHITKATVNPYYGREIPGWREAGLDPEAVYYGFRDPEELKKSLSTWQGLPLHIEHHVDSAEEPARLTRVGAVGRADWNAPYVDAPLTVWDGEAIAAIEDGSFRELSCAYRYDPDFTPGRYEGVEYDFIMRNIRGNHVALVEEGRAGPDVVVADGALCGKDAEEWRTAKNGKKYQIDTESGEVIKGNLGQRNDPFGPSFPAFKGKPKEAIEHLLKEKKGHVPGAFHKEGLGDIDLPYGRGGKKGFGLAHIIERRTEDGKDGLEFVKKLPEIIREGTVEERKGFPGRKYIVHNKNEAVVRLEWDGKSRNWILTAYPYKEDMTAKDSRLILTFDDNQKFIFFRVKKEVSDEHGKFSQDTCLRKPGLVFSRPGLGAETSVESIVPSSRAVNARGKTTKGAFMGKLKRWFRGAQDDNPEIEKQEVELAQAIIDLHKVDPVTGEIVDITEDEDKAEEIRRLIGELSAKLDPQEVKKLTDSLTDLACSRATGDERKADAMDEEMKKAMDKCGLDAEDPTASQAFAEGVKYGEELERNPEERRRLDREHESEGMKKAMDACGLDAENPAESRAFAEGVKYGEELIRNPEERRKLDREHEAAGMKKAMGKDEDKNAAITRILDDVPDLTPEQRKRLFDSLQDLAYSPATGDADPSEVKTAQDRAFRSPRHLTAMDAARIKASAIAEAQDHMRGLHQAVRDVRGLVGDLDPLSFDSASDVYGYALKQSGIDPRRYPRQAWRGMIDMLRAGKTAELSGGMARDAAPARLDGKFAGLNNISLAD